MHNELMGGFAAAVSAPAQGLPKPTRRGGMNLRRKNQASAASAAGESAQTAGRPAVEAGVDSLGSFRKDLYRVVLDTLNEESIWNLAHSMLNTGYIQPVLLVDAPRTPGAAAPLGVMMNPGAFGEYSDDAAPGVCGGSGGRAASDTSWEERPNGPPGRWLPAVNGNGMTADVASNGLGVHAAGEAAEMPAAPSSLGDADWPEATAAREAVDVEADDGRPLESGQNLDVNGDGGSGEISEHEATTLIMRNLPSSFDQDTTQEWVDEKGYADCYDFLLFFPAKQVSSRNSYGYAFVNFKLPEIAQEFQKELHLYRVRSDSVPLSVAVAKVQGFASNYNRFSHLLAGHTPTRCQPYFAPDAVASMVDDQGRLPGLKDEWIVTTVVVRNLPPRVESADNARGWLDEMGFRNQYDFLLFLPAKRRWRTPDTTGNSGATGLGYMFINFIVSDDASRCLNQLNGRSFNGDPVLSVVGARVQGAQQCMSHFKNLLEKGQCTPWVRPGGFAMPEDSDKLSSSQSAPVNVLSSYQ